MAGVNPTVSKEERTELVLEAENIGNGTDIRGEAIKQTKSNKSKG